MRVALLLIAATAFGCRPRGDVAALKHDLGRAHNDVSPHQWITIDTEAYLATVGGDDLNAAGLPLTALAKPEDPARARVQFWLDQIDKVARAIDPEGLANAPKPIAALMPVAERNAHSGYSDVCLSLKARFDGAEGIETAPAVVFDRGLGQFRGPIIERSPPCITATLGADEQKALLDWTFKPYPACTYTLDGNEVQFGAACRAFFSEEYDWLKATQAIESLNVVQSVSWIVFYSGLMRALTEEQFVGIAAHELAHYYMSHANAPRSGYGQFYWLGATNPDAKPKNDPEAATLGAAVLKAMNATNGMPRLVKVPGQRYHTALYSYTQTLAKTLAATQCGSAAATACTKPCGVFSSWFWEPARRQRLAGFPEKPLKPEAVLDYEAYEAKVDSCLESVAIGDGAGKLKLQTLRSSMNATSPRVTAALKIEPVANLKLLWEALNPQFAAALDAPMAERDALAFEATAKHLSQFTYEQEADELSAEWLTRMGLAPTFAVEAQLAIFAESPGYAACVALRANGWRDPEGKPVYVDIGDLRHEHHGGCFRAFNVEREIEAHHLAVAPGMARPMPPGPKWQVLQEKLAKWEESFQ